MQAQEKTEGSRDQEQQRSHSKKKDKAQRGADQEEERQRRKRAERDDKPYAASKPRKSDDDGSVQRMDLDTMEPVTKAMGMLASPTKSGSSWPGTTGQKRDRFEDNDDRAPKRVSGTCIAAFRCCQLCFRCDIAY